MNEHNAVAPLAGNLFRKPCPFSARVVKPVEVNHHKAVESNSRCLAPACLGEAALSLCYLASHEEKSGQLLLLTALLVVPFVIALTPLLVAVHLLRHDLNVVADALGVRVVDYACPSFFGDGKALAIKAVLYVKHLIILKIC